jgi:hypothetical protein
MASAGPERVLPGPYRARPADRVFRRPMPVFARQLVVTDAALRAVPRSAYGRRG